MRRRTLGEKWANLLREVDSENNRKSCRAMRNSIFFFAFLVLSARAELPMSVPEYIFGQSGMTNYVDWCTVDGLKEFRRKVFFFSRAVVKTSETELPGVRNSYQISMATDLDVGMLGKEDVWRGMCRMRRALCGKFGQDRISEIRDEGAKMSFCGKDVDGLKWDVWVLAVQSNSLWHVSCELHREGKYVGCELE